jgi:hypothetical protein
VVVGLEPQLLLEVMVEEPAEALQTALQIQAVAVAAEAGLAALALLFCVTQLHTPLQLELA